MLPPTVIPATAGTQGQRNSEQAVLGPGCFARAKFRDDEVWMLPTTVIPANAGTQGQRNSEQAVLGPGYFARAKFRDDEVWMLPPTVIPANAGTQGNGLRACSASSRIFRWRKIPG